MSTEKKSLTQQDKKTQKKNIVHESEMNREAIIARETEIKNMIKQCDLLLLIYMLKTSTNVDNAMSVSDVADQLDSLIPSRLGTSYFPDRTLRRKFELFVELAGQNDELLTEINKLLPFVFGGNVTYRSADGIENGTNIRSTGSQKRFYFDPVLKPGDMDMICGAVQSSRYLSDKEKEYLLSRLYILAPEYEFTENSIRENSFRHIYSIDSLPSRPKKDKNALLPFDTSTILSHVQLLHEAIAAKYQVEIVYGKYDISDGSEKLTFNARNDGKPYVLNPYAMLWNDGEYYLIATHYNFTNPVHFRVDRIISVKIHTKTNKDGTISEVKRKKIPPTLTPFFTQKSGQAPVFDAIKYSNTYPGMRIYQNTELVNCCFECTAISLQILIDNFGPNIRLKESPIKHSEDEVDYLGRPQKFLAATIHGIQYDNALAFCIGHPQYITLLSPQRLVDDVKNKLNEITEKYNKYYSSDS